MIIVQHLLVLFLAIGAPLWDWYEIPRLKASTDPRKKIKFYGKIMAASWVCTVVALLTIGISAVFTIRTMAGDIAWLDPGSRGRIFLEGLAVGILAALFIPAGLAIGSEKIRKKAAKAARRLAFLVPSTREERGWWWPLCLTAGICEEVVYRGFLLHYFHVLPFHLTLTWALVASSLIFGVGHLYQGAGGGISSAALGFVLGAIFVITGNLIPAIVAHAVIDLRVLAMVPEGFENAPD